MNRGNLVLGSVHLEPFQANPVGQSARRPDKVELVRNKWKRRPLSAKQIDLNLFYQAVILTSALPF